MFDFSDAPMARVMAMEKGKVFLHYAKVELVPPTPFEIPEAFRHAGRLMTSFKTGAWKHVPGKEAFINAMVCTEVMCWFWLGECIGRGSIIGYNV